MTVDCDTPAIMIDESRALRNIARFQSYCDRNELRLRPHIKTHKTVHFAQAQLAAGAVGITCQKIGEAEAMAAGGIDDILIAYNILGDSKLQRLRSLASRVPALAVSADSPVVIEGLSDAFQEAERPLTVLVECDTGGKRCGVGSPTEAVALAHAIRLAPGLTFGGLMTYPAVSGQGRVEMFMRAARDAAEFDCPVVSSGGSPDMWSAASTGIVTEYRVGTYIFNDRSLMVHGVCDARDCAAHIVATVVSVPSDDRAVIDAGSKVLTSDLLGLDGYGCIVGRPGIRIAKLSEEHGVLQFGQGEMLHIGDQLEILPNHVCVTMNMLDTILLRRQSGELSELVVDARGMVR